MPLSYWARSCMAAHPACGCVCSKGTYIRTLGEDIAQALGCGGHLQALRRVATGPYVIGAMPQSGCAARWRLRLSA